MQKYGKHYKSVEEVESRFRIFRKNAADIAHHNADVRNNFTMAVNKFADMTVGEFYEDQIRGNHRDPNRYEDDAFDTDLAGLSPVARHRRRGGFCDEFISTEWDMNVPESIDWRQKNVLTPVRDQGSCRGAWAIAATGALESAWAIRTGNIYNISSQKLIDCSLKYGNRGCDGGGWIDGAFRYIFDNDGVCLEEDYPWALATSTSCHRRCNGPISFSSCFKLRPGDEAALKQAVARGPVSAAVAADPRSWQFYSSGIISAAAVSSFNLEHALLVAGYGEDKGVQYWLMKNSWSAAWGDHGYVKVDRGGTVAASFPVV
jgi:cathepsin L